DMAPCNESMTGRTMVPTIPSIMFISGGGTSSGTRLHAGCDWRHDSWTLWQSVTIASTEALAERPLADFDYLFLSGGQYHLRHVRERYIAINHAYFYNDYVDQKLVKKTIPTSDAAYSYTYAGFSSLLILATVVCNVLVCAALIRMHRRFVRRTSLGTDLARDADPPRRGRSFGRLAGAEIQMVILLICTSAVVLICSIPLVAQVFLNQLYKTPVELKLEINPDLRAIRFASFNPILDPWIYILLRKAVLLKLIEKVKCLFCKMGARRQQMQASFQCVDTPQLSSAISNRVSRDLRDFSSTSQTFLYLPEGSEAYKGTCLKADGLSGSRPASARNSQASLEQGGVEVQCGEATTVIRDISALPRSKDPALQVSLGTEAEEEKCI
uniref:Prostaglandin E receptor 4 (subtype EP4) a n=1 Tax=Gasterosteus aculeatus aculeatus TaxID=481459 RepID=G3NTI3_GASAC